MSSNPRTGILVRREKFGCRHTQGEHHVQMEEETEGIGERKGPDFPSDLPERINPADILILDIQPPELWENKFLLS